MGQSVLAHMASFSPRGEAIPIFRFSSTIVDTLHFAFVLVATLAGVHGQLSARNSFPYPHWHLKAGAACDSLTVTACSVSKSKTRQPETTDSSPSQRSPRFARMSTSEANGSNPERYSIPYPKGSGTYRRRIIRPGLGSSSGKAKMMRTDEVCAGRIMSYSSCVEERMLQK